MAALYGANQLTEKSRLFVDIVPLLCSALVFLRVFVEVGRVAAFMWPGVNFGGYLLCHPLR